MKLLSTYLVTVLLISVSCNNSTEKRVSTVAEENSAVYTGPIIDMHIHAYGEQNPMFGMTHPPTLRNKTYEGAASAVEHKEKVLAKFAEHNVVKAMVTSGELWKDDSTVSILIGGANKEIDELKKQHQEGNLHAIAEMAPFYAGILANDPSQMKYFELAEELGIPVGFHVFPGGPNSGFHLMPQMLGGMRTYNAHPEQLEEALVTYPNLKLYIMHGGWPYVDEVKALMYAHPNVYVDIAVLNWILPQEEFNAYLRSLINTGFGDRILHGTDQMVWPDLISVGIETVNNADFLTLEQKEDIFFDNAANFLGMSDEEIAQYKKH